MQFWQHVNYCIDIHIFWKSNEFSLTQLGIALVFLHFKRILSRFRPISCISHFLEVLRKSENFWLECQNFLLSHEIFHKTWYKHIIHPFYTLYIASNVPFFACSAYTLYYKNKVSCSFCLPVRSLWIKEEKSKYQKKTIFCLDTHKGNVPKTKSFTKISPYIGIT